MPPPAALSADEAREKILLIVKEGRVEFTHHCRQRMQERNVDANDVREVLKNGQINQAPSWDEDRGNWTCRIRGEDIEGDDLSLAVAIIDVDMLILVVTVMSEA